MLGSAGVEGIDDGGGCAAAVAGDEGETVWFGTMSCVSERIAGADLVRGFFAKLERADAKMVG